MGQRQSSDEPADAKWMAMNALEMQVVGKFAVQLQNEKHGRNLKFQEVYKAWDMILDPDSGNLYLLHLIALRDNMEIKYGAIVWVQPDQHRNINETWKLVSFREVGPDNPPQEWATKEVRDFEKKYSNF